jgi:hypothetical protein
MKTPLCRSKFAKNSPVKGTLIDRHVATLSPQKIKTQLNLATHFKKNRDFLPEIWTLYLGCATHVMGLGFRV